MSTKPKKSGTIHDTVTGYDFRVDKPLGRKAAIRAKCMECQCAQNAEVRNCDMYDCTLWPYRMGLQKGVRGGKSLQNAGKTGWEDQ